MGIENCLFISRGQLGHSCLEDESEPKLIEALAGIKILQIATGGWHSCALSEEGDLYTWGWNSNGQLGISEDNIAVQATPQVVTFDGDVDANVRRVGCGMRHTVALLGRYRKTESNTLMATNDFR